MKRRIMAICIAACMASGLLTGVTVQAEEGANKYEDPITVDVFASEANYQGMQAGWFGKMVKDKFNMELNIIAPNVAGGGDTLFQTRSAAGDLGDLIICNTSNGILAQLVKAGLVQDMTDLLKDAQYVTQYSDAIESMKDLSGAEGIFAIPTEVSSNSPTTPSQGLEPGYAPYIRWDVYEEIGCPEINNTDELLDVLKQMQEAHPTSDSGNKVYAISLFSDWDRNMMTLARNITCMYGYDEAGITLLANDGSEVQSPIADDSIYRKGLEFLYKANQMGLVDPDSTTQNYDTMYQKMQDGAVLFSFWSWMGQGAYNTTEHTAEGKGFKMVPVKDMKIGVGGCKMLGYQEIGVMIGSNAEDPQRLADFIDWLYSPEGVMASQASGNSSACGPEGLTWELKDGKPVLTEFGQKALGGSEVNVPDEWGGGAWKEGVCALNITFVNTLDPNPETNEPYMYTLWNSTIEDNKTKLDEDWTAVTGAVSAMEYLENNDMLEVAPGDSYVTPDEDSQISNLRTQCGASLTDYSWRIVFSEDDDQFNTLYKEMQDTVEGLNFKDVFEYDKERALEKAKAREEVVELYNKAE
ncbi:MAG: extracellular solute-binding protein [Eubacteriales bacterium]|nr:extracellular solute-binding protein [Eubacteriales bacterium]